MQEAGSTKMSVIAIVMASIIVAKTLALGWVLWATVAAKQRRYEYSGSGRMESLRNGERVAGLPARLPATAGPELRWSAERLPSRLVTSVSTSRHRRLVADSATPH